MKTRFGPTGIHLFDRVSGLNILIDEVVPLPILWSRAPRHVSIALTNICDLSCRFCYAPKSRAVLDFEAIVGWLHELDSNGTIGVGFGGGEPTLYKRFAELCTYAAANTKLAVSFTSHGHHLNDELLSALKGSIHFVRISVDGIGDTYERLRNRSFAALQQRLTALRKIVPFGINYVVNDETLPDLDDAIRFGENIGASEFLLLPERPVNGMGGLRAEKVDVLKSWVTKYSSSMRLGIGDYAAAGISTCDPFRHENGLYSFVHIDATGILKRTSYDSYGVPLLNITILEGLSQLQKQ